MWPDDRLVPFPDDRLEPDLAELADAFEAAGQRAAAANAPSRPFARDLRDRLTSAYPAAPAVVRPQVRRRRPVRSVPVPRSVPWYRSSVFSGLAAAAVVVLAVVTLGGDRG